jgi:23S rRNA pseudouridine2605 synthase
MSKKTREVHPSTNPLPKLQKFLAESGLCSRRTGEQWIEDGNVSVNGTTATLGTRVDPSKDVIKVGNRRIQAKFVKPVTFAVNKPKGFTCSNDDPHAERLVFELLETKHRNLRLFCAGRLDRDSEGLMILTNDGKLTHALTHPSGQVQKKYQVEIDLPLQKEHLSQMLDGVEDMGEWIRLDQVRTKNGNPAGGTKLEILMGHGKKREIRRCFAHFRYRVRKLRRTAIGGITLGKLPLGNYRQLKDSEIDLLFPR